LERDEEKKYFRSYSKKLKKLSDPIEDCPLQRSAKQAQIPKNHWEFGYPD
jgi:hypothetical protein